MFRVKRTADFAAFCGGPGSAQDKFRATYAADFAACRGLPERSVKS